MLFVEQVRQLSKELNLIDVATTYTASPGAAWATLHDYGNVTLPRNALLVCSFEAGYASGGPPAMRFKMGATVVFEVNVTVLAANRFSFILYLAAGTYDFLVEDYNGTNVFVQNIMLGVVNFSDEQASAFATYSAQISKTVTARTTCIGALKNAAIVVTIEAYTPAAQTNFENVGESLTNGVDLAIDGVQVSWTTRYQDTVSRAAAGAKYYGIVTVGSAHTVAITKDNANTVVQISVYLCPWILFGSNLDPVTLSFPQGSTLYVTLEPLDLNPTAALYLGVKRSVSWGAAADYYYTVSGTGIQKDSYTRQNENPSDVGLYASGLGACMGQIGVDVRGGS